MRSRRESPLLPYTTYNKLPTRSRTRGTSTLKRWLTIATLVGLFVILAIGTFNYLGYDESSPTTGHGAAGKRRGLASEEEEESSTSLKASPDEERQDQTHQLQTQGLGHEASPDLELDKSLDEGGRKVAAGQSADEAARSVDSTERVYTFSPPTGLYSLAADDIDGARVNLSVFAGKVTLVVNVASQCGYTESNYKGLKELYAKHHKAGLEILAFPCNSFGNQEPGDQKSIKEFVRTTHGIEFPLFAKVDVKGPNAHPIFHFLQENLPKTGGIKDIWEPQWNFSKWLVDKEGMPVKHYDSNFEASLTELEQDIAAELLKPAKSMTSSQ